MARIISLAEVHQVNIQWHPFSVKEITRDFGMPKGPFGSNPPKLRYMWRDLERRAAKHELPYSKPEHYPVDYQQTALVGLVAEKQGWIAEYTQLIFHRNFVDQKAIGSPGNLEQVLVELGQDVTQVLEEASGPDTIARLQSNTELAKSHGIFGSPSFIANGELFWGDDRLDEAFDHLIV